MLVFIDESGDPGFSVENGATPIFVAAMVIFESDEDARATQHMIENSRARRLHKPEFKFSKCSIDVRDAFFEAVKSGPFMVRAIVVEKRVIYSPRLKADKDKFYEYFVKQMLWHDNDRLRDARVIIDGSGDREFRNTLKAELRRRLAPGAIRDVRIKDSDSDVLVQLADMSAGAIARSFRTDRPDPNRWRRMLGCRIDDVWSFR